MVKMGVVGEGEVDSERRLRRSSGGRLSKKMESSWSIC